MGEYANYNGGQVKIGTCEDMYYLRADQRFDVQKLDNSLDPANPQLHGVLRFRFPFPDEDFTPPGHYADAFRSLPVPGMEAPEGVEHHMVQFQARAGYLTSMPCPESGNLPEGVKVHRNSFPGAVRIVQQKIVGDHLALVCECACGAKWRLETLEEAQPIIDALRNQSKDDARRFHEVADRIEAGYAAAVSAH